jgi:molecular chaperone DnaK
MSTPGALRIERPYESAEAYLEGDAWTVARSDMLLVGAEGVAQGTLVAFEIVLTSGAAVVRGEGRVLEVVAADDGRPSGLRVRFQRLEGDSKAMLRRALQKRGPSPRFEEMKSAPEASPPPPSPERAALAPATPAAVTDASPPVVPERSGVRHRAALPIVAPGNRDTLLARLRERAPRAVGIGVGAPSRRTAAE